MRIFEIIKENVNLREAAELYGIDVNRYGKALCPFHNDRHPSLYVADDHYYCFACGEHGDVIDFVGRLFQLSPYNAARKLIEEQQQELQLLTLRIEDMETLLDEVSSEAYDKAVDKVAEETMLATRKDDIRLAEDSKRWIQSPERKASRKEKEYAINRLDGLIKKIEYAMEKAVVRVVRQLKQPEKKKAVVEEIKKEVKPSIREKLALNVAKIQREEAERKQLNKGRSHSSDLEL